MAYNKLKLTRLYDKISVHIPCIYPKALIFFCTKPNTDIRIHISEIKHVKVIPLIIMFKLATLYSD